MYIQIAFSGTTFILSKKKQKKIKLTQIMGFSFYGKEFQECSLKGKPHPLIDLSKP